MDAKYSRGCERKACKADMPFVKLFQADASCGSGNVTFAIVVLLFDRGDNPIVCAEVVLAGVCDA